MPWPLAWCQHHYLYQGLARQLATCLLLLEALAVRASAAVRALCTQRTRARQWQAHACASAASVRRTETPTQTQLHQLRGDTAGCQLPATSARALAAVLVPRRLFLTAGAAAVTAWHYKGRLPARIAAGVCACGERGDMAAQRKSASPAAAALQTFGLQLLSGAGPGGPLQLAPGKLPLCLPQGPENP